MYKVLVVEDEEIIRKGLIFSFDWAKNGCSVVGEATNGKEGLDKILSEKPDIVITDIRMPILSGILMIQKGREKRTFASIILSGYSDFEYAKDAIKFGVTDYLLKPVSNEDLLNAIENAKQNVDILNNYEKLRSKLSDVAKTDILEGLNIENIPVLVQRIIDYLEKNYHKKILLENIAEDTRSSVTTINEAFKKEIGVTIHDYLMRLRVQKAIEYMREGNLHIYEIADKCGFNDTKYFRKVFRKYTGVSSTKFMEILLGREIDASEVDGETD